MFTYQTYSIFLEEGYRHHISCSLMCVDSTRATQGDKRGRNVNYSFLSPFSRQLPRRLEALKTYYIREHRPQYIKWVLQYIQPTPLHHYKHISSVVCICTRIQEQFVDLGFVGKSDQSSTKIRR
jgi:hypothetical protein